MTSLAFRKKRIPAAHIRAVYLEMNPSAVEVESELIFISKEYQNQLQEFARQHAIPELRRYDVWADLLEPYLDTLFTPEADEQRTKRLMQNGIPGKRVSVILEEIGQQMMHYNFDTRLWEWQYLGLYDVLSAMRAHYNAAGFADFYRRAMDIALTPIAQSKLPE
ncbi:MAG: hypothetical protein EOP52_01120 [Sphingobacteriales bacterium]|nr:MAG: hypothetical protein EOP52_01120 [Sphingobacteriales bacterium]